MNQSQSMRMSVAPSPNKLIKLLVMVLAVGLVLLVAGLAFIWFSGGSGDATMPVSAPALVIRPDDPRSLFHIVPEASEVRFAIDEILLGQPKTVVGITQQVAGELLVDFDNPTNSQAGTIRVNLNTLTTDNDFRNRALHGQILQSTRPEFEFAEFVPRQLIGLPDTVEVGETLPFQIVGDLRLRDEIQPVTFDAAFTLVSQDRLEGTARTMVLRDDFGLTIPEAPGVANVGDEVTLEIDFVAQAVLRETE